MEIFHDFPLHLAGSLVVALRVPEVIVQKQGTESEDLQSRVNGQQDFGPVPFVNFYNIWSRMHDLNIGFRIQQLVYRI